MLDRATSRNYAASGRCLVEVGRLGFIDCLQIPVDGRWPVSETSNFRIGLASKHSLNECRSFDKSVCSRKPRRLEHHLIHIESHLLLGARHIGRR